MSRFLEGLNVTEKSNTSQSLIFVVNSQHEFWHREFKGKIYEKSDSYQELILDLISRGHCPIFQIDNDPSELLFLSTLPANSLIVWCHSDEGYELGFNRRIAETSAIKLVLRPYRLSQFSFRKLIRALIQTLSNLRYSRNLTFGLKVVLWQLRGFSMQYRQWRVRMLYKKNDKKYLNILIGYTNIFSVSLLECEPFLKTPQEKSLFDLLSSEQCDFGNLAISFSGQTGQVVRETAIRALSKFPQAVLLCRDSYGASNIHGDEVKRKGVEYVEILNQSRLVLCPPGNISGESFRIFETVLMSRIPIAMGSVTSDPNYELPFKFLGPWHSRVSWGGVINEAINTDLSALRRIARGNFDFYKEEIKNTRLSLEQAVTS